MERDLLSKSQVDFPRVSTDLEGFDEIIFLCPSYSRESRVFAETL